MSGPLALAGLGLRLGGLMGKVWGLVSNPASWPLLGIAALSITLAVQTSRLHHAKADLGIARAAQIDPATHKPWKGEAELASVNLATCKANNVDLSAAEARAVASIDELTTRNAAITAAAQKAATAARTVQDAARRQASAIAGQKPGPDVCGSALALIHGSAP